jgi:hypothetical protein
MKKSNALLILLAGLSAFSNQADTVITTTYGDLGFDVDTSQDLIHNVLPTANGHTGSRVIPTLTDGQAPYQIPGYDGNNLLQDGCILTFDMGAPATIKEIQSYTAWPGDRYLQDNTVDVSANGTDWTLGVIAVVNEGTGTLA